MAFLRRGSIIPLEVSEAAVCRCSSKQMILKIPQYSQENTCVGMSFSKIALKFFIKKRLQHRYFPVNIAKFLRTAFVIVAGFDLTR